MDPNVTNENAAQPKRAPRATYRLQFNREFTFAQAAEAAVYLHDLGISDVYASPLFQAGPDSTHGYDICCFGRLNPNLGGPEDFERFTTALKELRLGLLLDMVPNHMGAALSNAWWLDVLENGRGSRYAGFFDIDWDSPHAGLKHKVLLPVLEDHFGRVLEDGKLRLVFERGKFFIAYHDRNFPVNAATLPATAAQNPRAVIQAFNGIPGQPRTFDKLDAMLRRQHYRLAYWRVGAEEINYRRFFDVTELVSLKMERPEVFAATHEFLFSLLDAGKVTGLRVDHPDGLWDPQEYFERLQAGAPASDPARPAGSPLPAGPEAGAPRFIVAEKILSPGEQLPADWPVDGTTGYDFLNRVNGLFINAANAAAFDAIYREFTGGEGDFARAAYAGKKQVLERSFASELNALTRRLLAIAEHARHGRDFTFPQARTALLEVIARFPVYRTYLGAAAAEIAAADRAHIQKAVRAARSQPGEAFDFLERLLLLELKDELDDDGFKLAREFVMKFQQLTGPATAKGLEDTAFYNFNRLVSLNEVGGDPGKFGVDPAEFHEANTASAARWPHTLLASATHDTKRGEDVRARLNVLSETPDSWREAVGRWSQWNTDRKVSVDGRPAPDANDEYLLYQTLVGAWPDGAGTLEGLGRFRERVAAYMLKAVREAKAHTSWTDPNAGYEEAVREFIERALTDNANNLFLDDLRRFQRRTAFFGRFNSLAQTLLKITSPGVPDFYQGSELWDLSLVDPDNRRPVDYARRRRLLAEVSGGFNAAGGDPVRFAGELLRESASGKIKLFLIWRALDFRRREPDLFAHGDYAALPAFGERREHVCAFARVREKRAALVVAPRLVLGLTGGREIPPIGAELWKGTMLPLPQARTGDAFRNVFTGEVVKVAEHSGVQALDVAEVLKNFPVALLERAQGEERRSPHRQAVF